MKKIWDKVGQKNKVKSQKFSLTVILIEQWNSGNLQFNFTDILRDAIYFQEVTIYHKYAKFSLLTDSFLLRA